MIRRLGKIAAVASGAVTLALVVPVTAAAAPQAEGAPPSCVEFELYPDGQAYATNNCPYPVNIQMTAPGKPPSQCFTMPAGEPTFFGYYPNGTLVSC